MHKPSASHRTIVTPPRALAWARFSMPGLSGTGAGFERTYAALGGGNLKAATVSDFKPVT